MANQLSFASLNYVKMTKGALLNTSTGYITCLDCRDRPKKEVRAMAHVLFNHIQAPDNKVFIYSTEEETIQKLIDEACRNYWKGELHWDVLLRKGAQNPDASLITQPMDNLRALMKQRSLDYNNMSKKDLTDALSEPMNPIKRILTDTGIKAMVYRSKEDGGVELDVENPFCLDPNLPTIAVIHGWLANLESELNELIKNAHMDAEPCQVIVFTWSLASNGFYPWPRFHVTSVGTQIGDILEGLEISGVINLGTTTVVGHSLGAHVAGAAGRRLGGKLFAIVALDPAGFLFKWPFAADCLARSDAMNVDVVHTSINFLGMDTALGHRDYYVNFGKNQHGCSWFTVGCDHSAAYRIYADAIRHPTRFMGRKCNRAYEIIEGFCEAEGEKIKLIDRHAEEGTYLIVDNGLTADESEMEGIE